VGDSLATLTERGTSVWLDDLSRQRLTSGNLAGLISGRSVRGVTSNPSIFEAAISAGAEAYSQDLRRLALQGFDVDTIIETLTTDDVRRACDLFLPVWASSAGLDGRVSIEVDPRFAHNTKSTIDHGLALRALVDRPNVMIKVPATAEGLPAITALTGAGVSVNVTLIFSVKRYQEVVHAYETGLRAAIASGLDVSGIHSVASFFISRVDTAVDAQLESIGSTAALALRGRAATANAGMAWKAHRSLCARVEWLDLEARGANRQRPLWASTGVKNPAYEDTKYVVQLAFSGCVNTMPESTLQAMHDHGIVTSETETETVLATAEEVWQSLEAEGVDLAAICARLEAEGVRSFIAAWERLRETVSAAMPSKSFGNHHERK